MTTPTKEQVREWMAQHVSEHRPPEDGAKIRRELGWDLIKQERDEHKEYKHGKDDRTERGP